MACPSVALSSGLSWRPREEGCGWMEGGTPRSREAEQQPDARPPGSPGVTQGGPATGRQGGGPGEQSPRQPRSPGQTCSRGRGGMCWRPGQLCRRPLARGLTATERTPGGSAGRKSRIQASAGLRPSEGLGVPVLAAPLGSEGGWQPCAAWACRSIPPSPPPSSPRLLPPGPAPSLRG